MLYELNTNANDVDVTLFDTFSLADTLQSGQTFRWKPYKDGFWGAVSDKVCYVSQSDNVITFHDKDISEVKSFWIDYFQFDIDYSAIRKSLEYDENVAKALDYCSGIHIMHQPLWETTISFIISANNNIPRIMGIIERLSEKFGEKTQTPYGIYYAFPTAEALANASVEDIHACGAGYRDIYIKKTAQAFYDGTFDSTKIFLMPYADSKKYIMTLYGVGPKVADCILLFAAGKEEAFPIDIWVRKVVCKLYLGVDDARSVSVGNVEKFAVEHFPKYAGYAQQVLFHYMRNNG